jgi:deazaflavin-dependent oxidoreductase (nitroreductase family)
LRIKSPARIGGFENGPACPLVGTARCRIPTIERIPPSIWRLLKYLPPRLAYSLGLGSIAGRNVLLLTTVGRRSGLPRVTPLLYDEIDGIVYVGSARGTKADWYQNLRANPNVQVTIGSRRFTGCADLITDLSRIAAFLEKRLRLHPVIAAFAMRLEGLSPRPSHEQLEEYAKRRALVAIRPAHDA